MLLDYGLNVEPDKFGVFSTYATIPNETTVAYALSIATISGTDQVYLIGFDGFDSNDHRQLEMIETFYLFDRLPGTLSLKALTPTTYPVEQSSIYSPTIESGL